MSTDLSRIPTAKRQQFAATLGLFAALFVAVGAVSATGPDTAVVHTFTVIALLVAVLLGLIAWGVVHSVRVTSSEAALDDVIEQAVAANPRSCDCGHEHDPTELHVVDEQRTDAAGADACAHDGTGIACAHSCDSCVLASMRVRPSPRPRPRPAPAER